MKPKQISMKSMQTSGIALSFDHREIIQLILQHGKSVGFNFNARDSDGHTAYHCICIDRNEELVALLKSHSVECGIDLNIEDGYGKTAEFYLTNSFALDFDGITTEKSLETYEFDDYGNAIATKKIKLPK